jgi:hypothetical protein
MDDCFIEKGLELMIVEYFFSATTRQWAYTMEISWVSSIISSQIFNIMVLPLSRQPHMVSHSFPPWRLTFSC